MGRSSEADWHTDAALFAALPGGAALIEWFGLVPDFHDATLDRLEMSDGCVTIGLRAFRTTGDLDSGGFFVLDRHIRVVLRLADVSGIAIGGAASAIVSQLRVRRLAVDAAGWQGCAGPRAGDIEIDIESSWGLAGHVFAGTASFEFAPEGDAG